MGFTRTVIHVQLDQDILAKLDAWGEKTGARRPSAAEAIIKRFFEALEEPKGHLFEGGPSAWDALPPDPEDVPQNHHKLKRPPRRKASGE